MTLIKRQRFAAKHVLSVSHFLKIFLALMVVLTLVVILYDYKSLKLLAATAEINEALLQQAQHSSNSPLLRTHSDNKGWKIVDWSNPISQEEEKKFSCEFTDFKSSTRGAVAKMCVHDFRDVVSNKIKNRGRWGDCDALSSYWNANKHSQSSFHLEIGANIGACVMEMLLETDAKIIAFEPHPMNLFNLKKTISALDESFQSRVTLFPLGLGVEEDTIEIFAAENNMGNSVIGKQIKDNNHPEQKFKEEHKFDINVERLDSILRDNFEIKSVKLDVQGFECNVLNGMGSGIASSIDTIKFELSGKWLRGQGCTETRLLKQFFDFGFFLYRHFSAELGFQDRLERGTRVPGDDVDFDMFASRQSSTAAANVNK
eukprot:CAMPEP_0116013202 /NCGR_PEP_ID=MMETSP0321-20121206/5589_1 /TAXON_ID=163516 /ORGANISM="Leptocylindrus danicus var. danicus, Strain B650" /LENGTH=371 /DNA_ID=CAMNT_0003482713 /DNA_START=387 /DNA_END=1502 /DNA_ORIENTATION=-